MSSINVNMMSNELDVKINLSNGYEYSGFEFFETLQKFIGQLQEFENVSVTIKRVTSNQQDQWPEIKVQTITSADNTMTFSPDRYDTFLPGDQSTIDRWSVFSVSNIDDTMQS